MARWFVTLLIIALAVAQVTARTVPSDAGLDDQKNVVTFGGLSGYSGIGSNGLPIGGIGGGVGTGADIVGVSGVAVGVGVGGNVGGSAGVGLGPLRGISRIRGKIGTGVGVGVGGGHVGSGSGIGTGSVPFP